jgi:hypothetical protein
MAVRSYVISARQLSRTNIERKVMKKEKKIKRPEKVSTERLSIFRMSCDGDRAKPRNPQVVIHEGIVKRWVGIGWVGERKATAADYQKYPETK